MRRIICIAVCLVLLLLCGCAEKDETPKSPVQPSGVQDSSGGETPYSSIADPELVAALTAGESTLLWRVEETELPDYTASTWSFTLADCTQLWAEIQWQVFPEATVLSTEESPEGGTRIDLQLAETDIRVTVDTNSLSISGFSPEQGADCAAKIAAVLSAETGTLCAEGEPDEEELLSHRYFFYVDGIPIDILGNPYTDISLIAGSGMTVGDTGGILLLNPIVLAESMQTTDLSACVTMPELQLLAQTQWRAEWVPHICVLEQVELIYMEEMVSTESGNVYQLIPSWQMTGRSYEPDGNPDPYSHAVSMVIDAIEGNVLRIS